MSDLFVFDLDDTLIAGYMARADKAYDPVEVLPGRREKLAELHAAGHGIGIASNQAGVAFGFVTETQVKRKMQAAREALGAPFVPIELRWCGAHPDASEERWREPVEVARRKPSGTMIHEIMERWEAELRRRGRRGDEVPEVTFETTFVGDRPEDEWAAQDAGVRFCWTDDFFGDEA